MNYKIQAPTRKEWPILKAMFEARVPADATLSSWEANTTKVGVCKITYFDSKAEEFLAFTAPVAQGETILDAFLRKLDTDGKLAFHSTPAFTFDIE